VWSAIKENMRLRVAVVSHSLCLNILSNLPLILQQTRRLHQETNMIISLREHLRIHKASVRRIIQGLNDKVKVADSPSHWSQKHRRSLLIRLDNTLQLLEYYDVTACSLLDQQQNLLSLVRSSNPFATSQRR
jgi:hypothetical protein